MGLDVACEELTVLITRSRSLRGTYISQPPATYLVDVGRARDNGVWKSIPDELAIRNDQGVTFGDVFDYIEDKVINECEQGGDGLWWYSAFACCSGPNEPS